MVVAGRVGDKMDQDDCIVTRSQTAPFIRAIDGEFGHADGEVLVSLELQRRTRDGDQSRCVGGQPGRP